MCMATYSTPPMNILDIVWNKLVGFVEIALKYLKTGLLLLTSRTSEGNGQVNLA